MVSLVLTLALAHAAPTLETNVPGGFYDAPFQVVVTSDGPTVHYTLDGSAPSEVDGTAYTGPIDVDGNTLLRVVACDTECTPVATHSYLFVDDVIAQGTPDTLPTLWGESTPADYEMDPEITESETWGPMLPEALLALPTMSLVLPSEALWDADDGIYINSKEQGVEWERATSVEWLDGAERWQIDAGLRIMGGSSRAPTKAPKHALRLLFKSEYGYSKLDEPVYGPDALTSFDTLALRAGYNRAWTHWTEGQRARAQYTRDRWAFDTQNAMGFPAPHARFVHVYINGLYWGIFSLHERPSAAFLSDTFGGSKDEWDALNAGDPVDGDRVAWEAMHALAAEDLSDDAAYAAVLDYLDVDSLIAHMVINHWGGNIDWDDRNWYAGRRRQDGARFKFFVWDSELTLGNSTQDVTATEFAGMPTALHHALRAHPDYRMRFADLFHDWTSGDGPLSDAVAAARYDAIAEELEPAIVAESARWGDYRRDVLQEGEPHKLYTKDDWDYERDRLGRIVFPGRTERVQAQYAAQGLYPTVSAPTVSPDPGRYPTGTSVVLTNPDGTGELLFTTDGTDPRLPGGAVSGAAQTWSGSLSLDASMTVFARVKDGDDWSPRVRAELLLDQDYSGLVINELHYHPALDTDPEFLEIHNTGAAVDLQGLAVASGVQFTFDAPLVVDAGGFVVLTNDLAAFEAKYGFAAAGEYSGQLKNSGETVQLVDGETVLDTVTWGDDPPWPTACDGDGPSLELWDPTFDNDVAESWGDSSVDGGTPGAANAPYDPATDTDTDSGDSGDTGDTADTGDTSDTGVPDDTADTGDSGDSGDTGDTDRTDPEDPRECSCGGGTAPGWMAVGVVLLALRRRRGAALALLSVGCVIREPSTDDSGDSGDTEPVDTGDFGSAGLFLNELMASNASTIADDNGAYPDWIELYNASDATISLADHFLSDDSADPEKWAFPASAEIAAGGFLLVYADGDTTDGDLHASFRLSADGESVLLFDADGVAVDGALDFPAQTEDISWARSEDGGGTWRADDTPTPGSSNED